MAFSASSTPGSYRYLPSVFQYSAGVAAEPGFEIERARFRRLMPLADGFAAIAGHLEGIGRPVTAFCACELRSPAPFTEDGFRAFNLTYVSTLERWGICSAGANPVARSNVCPEVSPPDRPCFYAFAYTVPARPGARPTFHVAGSGEAPEGRDSYRDHVVCLGDTSPGGLRQKARYVLGEMERRMDALGFAWPDVTATQLYTVHDIHPLLGGEMAPRGAIPAGLTWHYCRPPVVGLDYEMDVRGVARELLL
jgi:hypothetical protein